MFEFGDLLGRGYVDGKQDCYALVREYFKRRHNLLLPNFARPTRFWEDPHLDLYAGYRSFGFLPVFDVPLQVSDVLLMPLNTVSNTHAAVVVEGNQVLHHLPGQLSCLDPVHPRWSRRANIVLRHPEAKQEVQKVHLHEVIDPHLFRDPRAQAAIERVMAAEQRAMRSGYDQRGNSGGSEPS